MNNIYEIILGVPIGVLVVLFWLGLIYFIIDLVSEYIKNKRFIEEKHWLDNRQMLSVEFASNRELTGKLTEYGFLKNGWKSFNYDYENGIVAVKYLKP